MAKTVQPKLLAICIYVKDRVIGQFTDFFVWWAAFAYDFPYRCIIGTLLVTLLCCIGLIPGIPKWIDGAEALYSLPVSQARTDGNIHRAFFNETRTRPTFIIVTGQTTGENILTWHHLEALRKLDDLIRGKTVDSKQRRIGIPSSLEYISFPFKKPVRIHPSFNTSQLYLETNLDDKPLMEEDDHNTNLDSSKVSLYPNVKNIMSRYSSMDHDILTFEDICDRDPFGHCSVSSILEMDLFHFHKLYPDENPVLYVFDGIIYNLNKRGFAPHYLLGKAVETSCVAELPTTFLKMLYNESKLLPSTRPGFSRVNTMCIRKAEAFQLIYELIDKEEYRSRNEAWEKVLLNVLEDNANFGPFKVLKNAFRSRDDALRSSTSESSDVLFVGLTFGLIILYTSGLNFSCDLYKSKTYPALSGVLTATLGMIAGIGFMSFCGIAFVPTALVCPFLIIGVGTDDMFVIINSYSMTYMVENPKERCILSLRDTGLAITMTTITSLLSFFIGLNTDYLSIKNFCYFCAGGMLFGYVFVLTFFFPLHCLDAQREFDRKLNLFQRKKVKGTSAVNPSSEIKSLQASMEISTFTLGALMVRNAEHNAIRNYTKTLKDTNTIDDDDVETYIDSEVNSESSRLSNSGTYSDQSEVQTAKISSYSNENHKAPRINQQDKISQMKSKAMKTNGKNQLSHYNHLDDYGLPKKLQVTESLPKNKSEEDGTCFAWLIKKYHSIQHMSDYLLTKIALEGHHLGILRNIERCPSNGILVSSNDSRHYSRKEKKNITSSVNQLILKSFASKQNVHLYYRSLRNNEMKVFIAEPKGTVGRRWRQFLIRYYGPIILFPPMKVLILLCFTIFSLVSLYGCLNLETGLELKDLAATGSYLNDFDKTQAEYFGNYDFPVDIFFPYYTEWWNPDTQKTLMEFHNQILESGAAKFIANPILHMLTDEDLKPFLESGNPKEFQETLHAALMMEKGKYKQFEQNFVWEGSKLRAWKLQMLPGFMERSSDRALWMSKLRKICQDQSEKRFPLRVIAWNYMMLYYESDLEINSSVTSNMIVAALTMFIISILGMPEMLAAFLVILVMAMIDVGIIGFMFFWNIRMNMVSMICLLIAIGFSVDFSAHVCHTFMETEGQTRNQRVLETLVLMGNPVFHGAASSILGVLMLGFSESYIFRIFFKMMTLVMTFALMHSVIFLPVILSLVGNSKPHGTSLVSSSASSSQEKSLNASSLTTSASRNEKPCFTKACEKNGRKNNGTEWDASNSKNLSRCHPYQPMENCNALCYPEGLKCDALMKNKEILSRCEPYRMLVSGNWEKRSSQGGPRHEPVNKRSSKETECTLFSPVPQNIPKQHDQRQGDRGPPFWGKKQVERCLERNEFLNSNNPKRTVRGDQHMIMDQPTFIRNATKDNKNPWKNKKDCSVHQSLTTQDDYYISSARPDRILGEQPHTGSQGIWSREHIHSPYETQLPVFPKMNRLITVPRHGRAFVSPVFEGTARHKCMAPVSNGRFCLHYNQSQGTLCQFSAVVNHYKPDISPLHWAIGDVRASTRSNVKRSWQAAASSCDTVIPWLTQNVNSSCHIVERAICLDKKRDLAWADSKNQITYHNSSSKKHFEQEQSPTVSERPLSIGARDCDPRVCNSLFCLV